VTSGAPFPSEVPRGTISGRVDMSAAPPYLNDPIVTGGLGVPVVVAAFNLDNGTYAWVDTTLTRPDFSLTLPAGRYHIVAYGQGVADVAYVTGGYTGENSRVGRNSPRLAWGQGRRPPASRSPTAIGYAGGPLLATMNPLTYRFRDGDRGRSTGQPPWTVLWLVFGGEGCRVSVCRRAGVSEGGNKRGILSETSGRGRQTKVTRGR
jgi:hypothetical protein